MYASASTHLVVDVNGWFPAAGPGGPGPGTTAPPTVGQLRVGMTIAEAEATGEAYYVPPQDGFGADLIAYDPGVFTCLDSTSGRIDSLLIKDGHPWLTPEGIRLGSTKTELVRAYPSVAFEDLRPGVYFALVNNGSWGYQFYVEAGAVQSISFGAEIGRFAPVPLLAPPGQTGSRRRAVERRITNPAAGPACLPGSSSGYRSPVSVPLSPS